MSVQAGIGRSSNYFYRFCAVVRLAGTQLVRSPSHSRRAEAARRSARHGLLLTTIVGAAIIALMYALDAREIVLMPPRGTVSLWPVRILTDFGKSAYVLWFLGGLLSAVAIISPQLRASSQALLLGFGTRLQFVFFAVLMPVLTGEANAFNFAHFNGAEAYASFPSGHAVTSFALAFAVSAVWPQARVVMIVYAVLIAISRLVLLAHHPSDVVAGALIGVIGAMIVRYWFAARRLGFAIRRDGAIVPLAGPSLKRLKRVARGASAP